MEVFEVVIALLLGGAALAAFSRRIGAPYPALMALAGAGLALVPGTPTLVLDPELALTLFVAPVLVDAAFDASPRDLRANWRAIASLALGAVFLTIIMVAVVARWLVPDLPWAAAVALGAIVAPPDAAAASAVLRQLRPPHRLLVILEGESLFNDASALLIYRLAVGVATVGFLPAGGVLPTLLWVVLGSIALALVLVRLSLAVNARIEDVATAVVVQFCTAFGVWILAERLHSRPSSPSWSSRWWRRAARPRSCRRACAFPRGRCGRSRSSSSTCWHSFSWASSSSRSRRT